MFLSSFLLTILTVEAYLAIPVVLDLTSSKINDSILTLGIRIFFFYRIYDYFLFHLAYFILKLYYDILD